MFQNGVSCAKQTGAAVHVLSQYNRAPIHTQTKLGGPGALRYGAGGWHGADVVLGIWNPFSLRAAQMDFTTPDGMTDDQVWVSVMKYRDGPAGTMFAMDWDQRSVRFSDPLLNSAFGAELYQGLDGMFHGTVDSDF